MLIHRVVTVHRGPKVSELPSDLRRVFSVEETRAFEDSEEVFRSLADNCEWQPLALFLSRLSDECHWAFLVAGSEPAYQVWFGFRIACPECPAWIRLSTNEVLPGNPPDFLKHFYATVGGIRLGEAAPYYGWLPPSKFRSLAEVPANEADTIPREAGFLVQHNGDGSGEGYGAEGRGFKYTAEGNWLELCDIEAKFAEQLEDWLDRDYWL
jgi:hypothetical protein